MTIYPDAHKTSLIERRLPPPNTRVPQLSKETGIPKDTLYGGRGQGLQARGLSPTPPGDGERWSATEKLAIGVETAALNEAERGEYCRQRGLYPEPLHAWRRACEQANAAQAALRPKNDAPADKRRMQELERERRRQDKALAEAAAWLGLRNKAEAIGGEGEDV